MGAKMLFRYFGGLFLFFALSAVASAQTCQSGCASPPMPANCPLIFEDAISPPQYTVRGCEIALTSNWDGTEFASCTATPPAGSVLVDHKVTHNRSNGRKRLEITKLSSGSDIDLYRKVSEAYDLEIKEAIANGDSQLVADLEQQKKQHLEMLVRYKTNTDLVQVNGWSSGSGDRWDRWGGTLEVRVDLVVACVAPANLVEQIREHSNISFKDYATIRNVGNGNLWVSVGYAGGPAEKCVFNENYNTVFLGSIGSGQAVMKRFLLNTGNQFRKLCFAVSESEIDGQAPTYCELLAGEQFDYSESLNAACLVK